MDIKTVILSKQSWNVKFVGLQGKGYDTSVHMLSCFGGAGGQHAIAIANSLGISTVFVPKYAGILSAVGIFLADVVHEVQEPAGKAFNKGTVVI